MKRTGGTYGVCHFGSDICHEMKAGLREVWFEEQSAFGTSTPLAPHSWGELGVSFCHVFLHNSLMNILQKIFTDHFEEMIYLQHPRDSVIENVEKMINCGNPAFGGAMYTCPCCGIFKFVPFRCHSRFCPTCGNMYSIDRTTSMSFKLLDVQHRHCVFTIARELRPFFLQDRSLLNCLFSTFSMTESRGCWR